MIAHSVSIIKGGLGYMVKGQKGQWWGTPPPKRAEGDITGFSPNSRRRLRTALALAQLRCAGVTFGVTLTIPGDILTPDQVRVLWYDLIRHEFPRTFPHSGLIWRIELQQRKQAHWHCVAYLASEDCSVKGLSADVSEAVLAEDFKRLWRSLVFKLVPHTNWSEATLFGFFEHGADVQRLQGSAIVGYVCDHESKSKQAQLGWQGRQWGIVSRRNLDFEGSTVDEVTADQHKKAARQFRRLQNALRTRGGSYTGCTVTPSGNVNRAVFGRDADRLMACYALAKR